MLSLHTQLFSAVPLAVDTHISEASQEGGRIFCRRGRDSEAHTDACTRGGGEWEVDGSSHEGQCHHAVPLLAIPPVSRHAGRSAHSPASHHAPPPSERISLNLSMMQCICFCSNLNAHSPLSHAATWPLLRICTSQFPIFHNGRGLSSFHRAQADLLNSLVAHL